MGFFDRFKRKKTQEPTAESEPHYTDDKPAYHSSLDYFEAKETAMHCPECEKQQRHVHLKENDRGEPECPECHYLHLMQGRH